MVDISEDPSEFLSTIQIGITFANFIASAFAADGLSGYLADFIYNTLNVKVLSYEMMSTASLILITIILSYFTLVLGELVPKRIALADFIYNTLNVKVLSYEMMSTASLILITIILSYFTLVLGELVPKRIAMQKPMEVARFACIPVSAISTVVKPAVKFLSLSTNVVLKGLRIDTNEEEDSITEEARFACIPVSAISTVVKPAVKFLSLSTNVVLKGLRIDTNEEEDSITEEEIRMMLEIGNTGGTINSDEKEWIDNVFDFSDSSVREIMTHKSEVVGIYEDDSLSEIEEKIHETGYSRYPVYGENDNDIKGILYAKDFFAEVYNCFAKEDDDLGVVVNKNELNIMDNLYGENDNDIKGILYAKDFFAEVYNCFAKEDDDLGVVVNKNELNIMDNLRKPYFIPDSMSSLLLFKNMQKNNTHIAIVINEYGENIGLITMEDLLEEIVGNIYDEYDECDDEDVKISETTWKIKVINEYGENIGLITMEDLLEEIVGNIYDEYDECDDEDVKISETTWKIKGSTSLDDLSDKFDIDFPDDLDYDTISGLILEKIQRIPNDGEKFEIEAFGMKIKLKK